MKKVIALIVLPLLLAVLPVRANLLWYEGFNYSNGNITNVSDNVWTNFSGSGFHDMVVNNHHLEVSTTSSTVTNRADDDYRPFVTTPGSSYTNTVQVMYASFTIICTNLPNGAGSYFASFYNAGKGYSGRIQAFTNGTTLPNTWRIGVTGNTLSTNASPTGFPVDLALNTPYQVVEEMDPLNLDAATVWINPLNVSQTGFSPTDAHYTSGDSIGFATTFPINAFSFRQAGTFGNGFWIITNLTVATTFGDAYTNIVSTNAVAPIIVTQPVLGITNFVGATFAISALANGQGLGNMTYQWQLNGANYSGEASPTGNGNILTFNSAQTVDNGTYTLIATTPYGLSVTSTPSVIFVSTAPVPPHFITQPASTSVYVGQTVVFSTTVQSPGNLTYQWRSNGIAITGANSSSYELDNVQTSFSASYSVAVTNDVVVNGVISTNAVLTVLAPAQVTIAYLRSLVDPATFAATNVPATIPYQVTGVITTTNLTSANTAGYYLQDATAGINIFATGASTFRPSIGDVVTYVGVLSTFTAATGGLELDADTANIPYTSYIDTGTTAPLPTPLTIPFSLTNTVSEAFIATNIEGALATLNNVYFGTNSGVTLSTNANVAVSVTNSVGLKFNLEFYDLNLVTAGTTLPAFASSVQGVLLGNPPNFYFAVNSLSTTAPVVPIPLTITSTAGSLGFNWTDSTFVLQSSTNVVGPYVTITGAAPGFTTNVDTTVPTQFYRLFHQ